MKRVRFLNKVATNGFKEQVTLEPTPGGSKSRETFGHQMEGLSRQREQQVQSQGEAVWGCLWNSELPSVCGGAWGVRWRPTKQHLVSTWETNVSLLSLTNDITVNS